MHWPTGLAAMWAALFSPAAALAGNDYPQLLEQGYRIDAIGNIGANGLTAVDIDGDGADETVFGAWAGGGQQILAVLDAQADGSFRIAHERVVFPDDIVRVLSHTEGGQPRILTVGRNGVVREYGAVPFVELRRFQTQAQALTAALGDLDADGHQELVVLTPAGVLAYALGSGQLVRTLAGSGFQDMVLAQLDADPALEIVLTGNDTGRVLDGATSAVEWERPGGFGQMLTAGRFGPGGAMRWAGASGNGIVVYEPWSPSWLTYPPGGVRVLAHAADGPASDVLAISDYRNALSVYEPDQSLRFEFFNNGSSISSMIGADIAGDGRHAIVFASGETSSVDRSLGVLDVETGQLLGEFVSTNGPYLKTAIGDVDGDGRPEIVAIANQFTGARAVTLFDLATGSLKWTSPYVWPSTRPLTSTLFGVALTPRAQGTGSDVVLLDRHGSVRVIDGRTLETVLWIAGSNGESAADLALIDYDGDGTQDFVLGLQVGAASGAQIKVISGRDGTVLWRSVLMGGSSTSMSRVMVTGASATGDRRRLIAVLSDGLRAYDADTGVLEWALEATYQAVGYARNGANGPELIASGEGGRLQFRDMSIPGVTPPLLREYVLPASIEAVAALDEDVRLLLAATAEGMLLIDGTTGDIRARSPSMTPFSTWVDAPLSVVRQSDSAWQVVTGTDTALYRHRVVLDEAIFSDGLDGR